MPKRQYSIASLDFYLNIAAWFQFYKHLGILINSCRRFQKSEQFFIQQ